MPEMEAKEIDQIVNYLESHRETAVCAFVFFFILLIVSR